jgi:hypothetical protein
MAGPATGKPSADQIAQAVVAFSINGAFPEENVSSLPIRAEDLPTSIDALGRAKAKLEVRFLPFLCPLPLLSATPEEWTRLLGRVPSRPKQG